MNNLLFLDFLPLPSFFSFMKVTSLHKKELHQIITMHDIKAMFDEWSIWTGKQFHISITQMREANSIW